MSAVVLQSSMMMEIPVPFDVVPIAYQRFLCRMMNFGGGNDFYTYELANGDYQEYTGFPNLNLHEFEIYASRLFRMDDRYVVGVYTNNPFNRMFYCIDLQDETMIDTTLPITNGATEHSYKLVYGSGKIYYTRAGEVVIYKISTTTGNADDQAVTPAINLSVYPNPFSDKTTIRLGNLKSESTYANVYNQKGQLVKTLALSSSSGAERTVEWDGTDNTGKQVGQGVYLINVSDEKGNAAKKILKLR